MKASFLLLFLMFCLNGFSQKQYHNSGIGNLNPNDTSYVRILNGIIIKNNSLVKEFNGISLIRVKEDIINLGLSRQNKKIMIITQERDEIESKIDSILYSRPEFIKVYKFPLDIKLPISVNGELINDYERKSKLQLLTINQIKKINYLGNKDKGVNSDLTPFGLIALKVN